MRSEYHTWLVGHRVLEDLPVLDIDPPHLHQLAGVGAIVGDELGHHGHLLAAVHGEVGADPEVFPVALSPVVVVTAVLVTDPVISLVTVIVSTLSPLTSVLS